MYENNVLVLGAGYGGIFTAANLCKDKFCRVIMIDKEPHHQLLQQIHYLISGLKNTEDITVTIDHLFEAQKKDGQIEFLRATVQEIDLKNNMVTVVPTDGVNNHDQQIRYNYLVISLGAETNYFGIPGAAEYSLPFRSVNDALRIRDKVNGLQTGSSIIISGGGPTGVSLAAALLESDVVQKRKIKVKMIDASEQILSGWDTDLARTAERVLTSRGIEILNNRRVIEIKPQSVVTNASEEIESNCTIWTAGVKGRTLNTTPEVKKTKSNRLIVDRYCRLPGFSNAFAIGDISDFDSSLHKEHQADQNKGEIITHQLAQIAVREARFVVDNIVRSIKGQELNSIFPCHQRGHTIALGKKNISLLSGLIVTGDMCNYTEDTIVDNFVTEIINREQGVSAEVLAAVSSLEHKSARFDFVKYATSDAFAELVK